jgi:hypothetical protein
MSMGRWARAVSAASLAWCAWGCDDQDDKPTPGGETELDGGHASDAAGNGTGPGNPGNPGQQPGEGGTSLFDGSPGTHPMQGGSGDGGQPAFSNAFAIRGRLASAPGDKRQKGPGDAAVEHAVTHVMAVNPAAANPIRYIQELADDGTFAIGVDLNTPWVIVLVDSHKIGSEMVVGVFRAADLDLDSVAATRPGMLDMGDVTVDPASGNARASVSTGDLLTALGLSQAAAMLLGSMDDISLRYVNPDVDGNGKIDVLEGVSYTLDFHLRYSMLNAGQQIPYTSLLNRFADPVTTTATYGVGSAIVFWHPGQFGTTTTSDYRIRFATSSGNFTAPPIGGSYVAGEWIDNPAYFYTSAGTDALGISFDQGQPFPIGRYEFEVKHVDLTFTDVHTHSLEELNTQDDLIIPFLKVNAPDTTCTDWSCGVTGFDYQWMRHAPSGWVLATPEEVALIVPQHGGFLGFQPSGDMTKRLEFTIPGSPVTGTINFATPNNIQGGVTPTEISALTLGQICHVGISYDDTLGMRIFQGWQENPACNPPPTPPTP